MRLHRFLIVPVVFCLWAAQAAAEEESFWSFQGAPALPTQQQGLTSVVPTPQGIHLQTTSDGYLLWQPEMEQDTEVIVFRVRSPRRTDAMLMWNKKDAANGEVVQYPFVLEAANGVSEAAIPVGNIAEWNPDSEQVALGFPAGTDVVIQDMAFKRWTLAEKIAEGWKSFWTFDEFRMYSINFLWGPLLVFHPYAREALFATLPPQGWSANRIFYAILLLAGAGAVLTGILSARIRRPAGGAFAAVCIGLWALFDARMGSELLSYALTDLRTYVTAEPGERTLRAHADFYALMEKAAPILSADAAYVLIAPESNTFAQNLRYRTYPSLPVPPEQGADARYWLVLYRTDVGVENGRIVQRSADGQLLPLSGSGRVIEQFNAESFLFAQTP